ncbi:MAG: Lipoprotein [Modestobacter sp.]|nr:Lipoprotein [Modestobacter sp.]
MTRTTARLGPLTGALIAGTLVLAGCSDDSPSSAHDGHSSSSSDPSASTSTDAAADHNDADVTFAQSMLPHHEGAISMAGLAPTRAADPRVKDLAARIEAAQGPEIDTLTGWLSAWGADTDSGMDHGSMDGEEMEGMSEEDMTALSNASGADFDRLFLTQMIAHHTSAVDMAMTEAADGQNADAIAMAESIRDSQTAEIAEMHGLLTDIGS